MFIFGGGILLIDKKLVSRVNPRATVSRTSNGMAATFSSTEALHIRSRCPETR
jgi:hypothetical protein